MPINRGMGNPMGAPMGQPGLPMMGAPQQQYPGQMGGAAMGNYGFQQQQRPPSGW